MSLLLQNIPFTGCFKIHNKNRMYNMANLLVEMRDVEFVLFEQFNVTHLTEYQKFSHLSKDEFDMVLGQALKFAENVIAPTNKDGDEIGAVWDKGKVTLPESFHGPLKAFAEGGWVSAADDMEAGGQGLPLVVFTAANEMFHAANTSLNMYPCLAHGAGKLIEMYGTADQKKRFMEKIYSYEWGGSMCLTEPAAGSDLAHVSTKAVKMPDGRYKIKGQKIFITGGDYDAKSNIVHPVLARIEGDPAGIKGISIFIVPKYRVDQNGNIAGSNDVNCTGIEHKMGLRGSSTCQLNFGENDSCIGELLGEPRRGIMIMFLMMNEERLNVGVQAGALASAAYLNALNYARQRLQGTDISVKGASLDLVPIIKHPDIRRELMMMKSYCEGLRALNYYSAYCIDRRNAETDEKTRKLYSGLVEFFTPICKAYSSDRSYEICARAIQVYGGYGYCRDYPAEQFARDVKIVSLYEGTNGIQAIDLLGRKLPMANGEIFQFILHEIDKTIAEGLKDNDLKKYADIVRSARKRLEEAALYLLNLIKEGKVPLAYLSATPMLEVTGDTLLGWFHLQQLIIASGKFNAILTSNNIKEGSDLSNIISNNKEAAFYSGKMHSARFFITKVLTLQESKIKSMMNDERDALDIENAALGEEMPR